VGEGVPYSFQPRHSYAFSIICEANKHVCYIDREIVFQCIDADIQEGSAGLGTKYCGAGFQDVLVRRRIA